METGLVQNKLFTTPQVNGFFEYLLVVHPDEAVYTKLMEEKQAVSKEYQAPAAVKTKPHITVANFLAKEEMEPTLIRWMHRIISMQKSFRVTLDQYSGFAPHTIYLRVQDHTPFQQLVKELKVIDQYVKGYGCPAMYLSTRPHLTVVRNLSAGIYEQIISAYAKKDFQASFDVHEVILLRRQHQFDRCKQVNVFGLQPL